MSPEAVAADRIHRELKAWIMQGRFTAGLPLIVQALAEEFGTSISPVRDALHRLVGERLVEVQGGGGFAMPSITKRTAYHLYSWHADLVRMVIKVMIKLEQIGPPPEVILNGNGDPHAIAAATAELFGQMGACSQNPEHLDAILSAGERLNVLRLHEGAVVRQGEELTSLWNVTRSGNRNATRVAMWQYHRRRLLRVDKISSAAARPVSDREVPHFR